MPARQNLLALTLAGALAGSPLAGAEAVGHAPAFPLVPLEAAAESGELELMLIDAELEALAEFDALVFPDVPLPGGPTLDLELTRIDLERLDIGLHVDGRPRDGLLESLSISVWRGRVRGVADSEVALSFSRFGRYGWVRAAARLTHLVSEADPQEGWARVRTRWMSDESLRARNGPVDFRCADEALARPTWPPLPSNRTTSTSRSSATSTRPSAT
jgi:hypothetical protein